MRRRTERYRIIQHYAIFLRPRAVPRGCDRLLSNLNPAEGAIASNFFRGALYFGDGGLWSAHQVLRRCALENSDPAAADRVDTANNGGAWSTCPLEFSN